MTDKTTDKSPDAPVADTLVKEETVDTVTFTQVDGVRITLHKTDDGALDVHVIVPAEVQKSQDAQTWQNIVGELESKFIITG